MANGRRMMPGVRVRGSPGGRTDGIVKASGRRASCGVGVGLRFHGAIVTTRAGFAYCGDANTVMRFSHGSSPLGRRLSWGEYKIRSSAISEKAIRVAARLRGLDTSAGVAVGGCHPVAHASPPHSSTTIAPNGRRPPGLAGAVSERALVSFARAACLLAGAGKSRTRALARVCITPTRSMRGVQLRRDPYRRCLRGSRGRLPTHLRPG